MNEIDVIDEALIDADQATVYAALGDLIRGKAQWWLPAVEVRPRTEIGSDLAGAVYDLIVRRLPGPRSTLRIAEVRGNEMARIEYIGGPVLGVGTLTLVPVDGKTRATYRWRIRPKGRLVRLPGPLLAGAHRHLMRAFFDGLSRYVEREGPGHSAV